MSFLELSMPEILQISRAKVGKRRKASSFKDNYLIVSLVLKFVAPDSPDDTGLKTFLLLDKESSQVCRSKVYKQALIYETDTKRLACKRRALWKLILKIQQNKKDYYAFRDKVNSKSNQDRTFEDDGMTYLTQALST